MKFKTGTIILFKYGKYRRDKQPLVLILYGGDEVNNVHGLNLHYLSNQLTDELIDFILKIISRELSKRDMKALYHDYMKKKLHPIIEKAYRTYKPSETSNAAIVSRGFNETVTILQKFKRITNRLTPEDLTQIRAKIKSQIAIEKTMEKVNLKNVAMKTPTYSPDEIAKAVQEYVKQLNLASNKILTRKDFMKFTM